MALEGCSESCGWAFAILSALAWGSFGVPIKGKECSKVDVDPLVMQSYKTMMNAATSILLLWYLGDGTYTENYWVFSPWGIVSGLFWVPGATCGIYAIRTIGLAISQGLWSSIIVMTSFVVGIFFFHESVKSVFGAVLAMLIVVMGIGGMARYSSPERQPSLLVAEATLCATIDEKKDFINNSDAEVALDDHQTPPEFAVSATIFGREAPSRRIVRSTSFSGDSEVNDRKRVIASFEIESQQQVHSGMRDVEELEPQPSSNTVVPGKRTISILGYNLTKRQSGLCGAIINGVWGGSNLIPMHFARRAGNPGGLAYLVSFAVGSILILLLCWIIRFTIYAYRSRSLKNAYQTLPSLHIRELWLAGGISGFCYSVGNIGSILSVMYLGQGVGYSLSQSSMLISGLWGIFYYKEIRGEDMVFKWLLAAILTMVGILCLSYEHESSTSLH
jgi:glucose uptake protein GlcU